MKLIETLYELLVEAAPEQIYNKYYSDISRPEFLRIISLDPATKIKHQEVNGIKKIGRYAKLLLKMYKGGNLKSEDFPKAKDYLTLVYKHQVPVDMNTVKTLGDLFTLVEKYYSRSDNKNVFDLINTLDEKDYELLYSGGKWIIYKPNSEKGAAYLGTGTEWCTAWGPYSTNEKYKDRRNHFAHHNDKGWLYVMINRESPEEKYQFHFETKQFMDRNDRGVNTGDFFERHEEVTKFFYPSLFDAVPVSDEETDRMAQLSGKQRSLLISKSIGETDNVLVRDLVDLDGDELIEKLKNNYIKDDSLSDIEFEYTNRSIGYPTIRFEFEFQSGDLDVVRELISAYEMESDSYANHSDWLRDDITNSGDEDWVKELIEPLLKEYYDKYVTITSNYEEYRSLIEEYYDSIVEDYADEYAYLNDDAVRSVNEVELNKITNLIYVNDGEVSISPANLALFLHREKLTEITDLDSLFSAYCDYHGLVYDYENPWWEQNPEQPTLSEMSSHLDGYTEKIEEELNSPPEYKEKKERLMDIRKKFFNGSNYYSRDDLRIELKSGYKCEEDSVEIYMDWLDKSNEDVKNWQRYRGKVDLDRLVAYVTNEKLFEGN